MPRPQGPPQRHPGQPQSAPPQPGPQGHPGHPQPRGPQPQAPREAPPQRSAREDAAAATDPFEQFRRKKQEAQQRREQQQQQQAAPAGADSTDPFEQFRRQKQQARERRDEMVEQAADNAEALEDLGWVDGLGPAGAPADPKLPKGFVRGRYERKAVDPSSLQRPAGYEATHLARPGEVETPEEDIQKPSGFQRF